MSNRDFGTVVHWSQSSGYGFIRPIAHGREARDARGPDLFFHATAIGEEPSPGDRVSYLAGTDRAQRPCALQVRFVADDAQEEAISEH
jgi:cold shock CspA family protein